VPAELLALDHLTKRYGSRTALDRVSFTLGPGEAVGYLGPNGAGKTTTFRLISGLAAPDAGHVRLNGVDPARSPVEARRGVGVLVESPGVVPYLSARDLLGHIAERRGVPRAERRRSIEGVAERLGVADHLDRAMGDLSTGLTRRVQIAGALVGEPSLLLLDEPTLGLDPAARADLRELLRSLRKDGRSILLSTHLLDDVLGICERVLFLRDGHLVGDEPVEDRPVGPDGRPVRRLELEFASEVSREALRAFPDAEVSAELIGSRTLSLEFSGDDTVAAGLVAGAVRAGLPLLHASEPPPDLERRYLERVGREEPG
jgi:ABC-2 type transport system ATP-binding protein